MCNKFSTLLDLKGAVGTVLAKGHDLASAFAGAEQGTSCSARRSSPKGMVVSETSSGKYVKRKVAPVGQHGAKDKGSFEAYASYLRDAFDGVTKVIQLAEAKLGSGDLSMGQEDGETGTLEEYATVLPFELSGTNGA
ncbi:hypothetical protein BHM03_00016895 [Ensete ventricosum]|nr:hypothetical protein BHM03_00016895 [Ensete ventricosum]